MNQLWAAKKLLCFAGITSLLACLMLGACGDNPQPAAAVTATNTPAQPTMVSTPNATTVTVTQAATATPKITVAPSPTPKIEPTSTTFQENWLKGVPCKAPCWENITPGETTPQEAQKLLKDKLGASDLQVNDPKFGDKPVAIYWSNLNFPNSEGFLSYHNQPNSPHIEIIKPLVQTYALKQVQSLYGEPSHVMVDEKTNELGRAVGEFKTYLIYLDKGLILSNSYTKTTELTPETRFNETYFFIPGQDGFNILDAQDNFHGKTMVKWEGFKDVGYYCRYETQTAIKKCS